MSIRRGKFASKPKRGFREDLGFSVRSAWEANYARYLKLLEKQGQIKAWHYEPREFKFPVKRGVRSFRPDFEIMENTGRIEYHEVKGFMTPTSRVALNHMKRYYADYVVHVIDRKAYKEIEKKLGALIDEWEWEK